MEEYDPEELEIIRKAVSCASRLDAFLSSPNLTAKERIKRIKGKILEARKVYKEIKELYERRREKFIEGKMRYLETQIKIAEAILSSSEGDI